jgi:UDP-N-acetylglucosamine 2-epimerase (non-hydrolysing)
MQADWTQSSRLLLTEPLSYFEFIGLEARAALVITDSGGVQEETTYLGVPCLTVRDNTERPVTVTTGTNRLIGRDPDALLVAAREELEQPRATTRRPELWDGHAGERAATAIVKFLS